ncbi:MAG: hypothetical protein KDK62_07255 [Chlamydiia bacterium]|nr:hypothetical protein [Chlamydiia bacterium]
MTTLVTIGPNYDWKGTPGVFHDENAVVFIYGKQNLPQLDIKAKLFFSITNAQIAGNVHVVAQRIFAGGNFHASGSRNFNGDETCSVGLQAVELFEIIQRQGYAIKMNQNEKKYKLVRESA